LGKEIRHVPEDDYYCFLWPNQKSDYLMSALYDYNIWNGLSMFKSMFDSCSKEWPRVSSLFYNKNKDYVHSNEGNYASSSMDVNMNASKR